MSENTIRIIDDTGNSKTVSSISGLKIKFRGTGNDISVYEKNIFHDSSIFLGNNTKIKIGKTKHSINALEILGKRSTGGKCIIGNNFSCEGVKIMLSEKASVLIGDNCMFSFDIYIWASDGHPMYKMTDKKIFNKHYETKIGNHVWVCQNVTILRNSLIPNNSICGNSAVISGHFNEENIVLAGNPAKIVNEDIGWDYSFWDVNGNEKIYL